MARTHRFVQESERRTTRRPEPAHRDRRTKRERTRSTARRRAIAESA